MYLLFKNSVGSRQAGFSLVELMVGLLVGSFVMLIATTALLSSNKTFKANIDDSRIQENARFSLDLLSKTIREAGFSVDNISQQTNYFYTGTGCSAAGAVTACLGDNIDQSNRSDRLAMQTVIRPATGNLVAPANATDCFGRIVPSGTTIVNSFWVADVDGDGVSSLNCEGFDLNTNTGALTNRTNPAALIDGIDALQVQYGLDTDADGVVNTYASYNRITANALDIETALTVRIGLIANSGLLEKFSQDDANTRKTIGTLDNSTRSYSIFDLQPVAITDDVMRQIYSTTIKLTN